MSEDGDSEKVVYYYEHREGATPLSDNEKATLDLLDYPDIDALIAIDDSAKQLHQKVKSKGGGNGSDDVEQDDPDDQEDADAAGGTNAIKRVGASSY